MRQHLYEPSLAITQITNESEKLLSFLEHQSEKAFDPRGYITAMAAMINVKFAFGTKYDITHPAIKQLKELIDEQFYKDKEFMTCVYIFDHISLARFFLFGTIKKLTIFINKRFQALGRIFKEQEEQINSAEPSSGLAQVLIKSLKKNDFKNASHENSFLTKEHVLNLMHDLYAAGLLGIASSLLWCIGFLASYPEFQDKMQKDIDNVVGQERIPSIEDSPRLPSVHAFIMEVLRVANIGSNGLPRCATKDTTLCGYRVPKGTVVMVDLDVFHHNPKYWKIPEEFNPNRFIDSQGHLKTNQGNWFPFSAGRRSCAGESLAKVELFLFLSAILHHFTIVPEDTEYPFCLKGSCTLGNFPLPFKVRAIKRF